MLISGSTRRSMSDQTGVFGYSFDVSLNNSTGSCKLGFSGDRAFGFTLRDGKIYDPDNRFVEGYEANVPVRISGQVGPNSYDYYINNRPISLGASSTPARFSSWYVNPVGVVADTQLKIAGEPPKYFVDESGQYKGLTSAVSGHIVNLNPALRFRIFDVEIVGDSPYYLSNYTTGDITGSGHFSIRGTGDALPDAVLPLRFHTDFGTVDVNYAMAGRSAVYKNVYLVMTPEDRTVQFGTKQTYTAYLANSPEEAQISVSLEYVSGVTGDVYKKVRTTNNVTGVPVSGRVTGCGALVTYYRGPISAIDPKTNLLVTGEGSGYLYSDVLCPTGSVTQSFRVKLTGLGQGTIKGSYYATGRAYGVGSGDVGIFGAYSSPVIFYNVPGSGDYPMEATGIIPRATGQIYLYPTGNLYVESGIPTGARYSGTLAIAKSFEGWVYKDYELLAVGYATGGYKEGVVTSRFSYDFEPGFYVFTKYFEHLVSGYAVTMEDFNPARCEQKTIVKSGILSGTFAWPNNAYIGLPNTVKGGYINCNSSGIPSIEFTGIPSLLRNQVGGAVPNHSVKLLQPIGGFLETETSDDALLFMQQVSGDALLTENGGENLLTQNGEQLYTEDILPTGGGIRTRTSRMGSTPSGDGYFKEIIQGCAYANGEWREKLASYEQEVSNPPHNTHLEFLSNRMFLHSTGQGNYARMDFHIEGSGNKELVIRTTDQTEQINNYYTSTDGRLGVDNIKMSPILRLYSLESGLVDAQGYIYWNGPATGASVSIRGQKLTYVSGVTPATGEFTGFYQLLSRIHENTGNMGVTGYTSGNYILLKSLYSGASGNSITLSKTAPSYNPGLSNGYLLSADSLTGGFDADMIRLKLITENSGWRDTSSDTSLVKRHNLQPANYYDAALEASVPSGDYAAIITFRPVPVVNTSTPTVPGQQGQVEFAYASYSGCESWGYLPVRIQRIGGDAGLITGSIDLFSEGKNRALPNTDYYDESIKFSLGAGEYYKDILVPIIDEGDIEVLERFTAKLSAGYSPKSNSDPSALGSRNQATLFIWDDDNEDGCPDIAPLPGSIGGLFGGINVSNNISNALLTGDSAAVITGHLITGQRELTDPYFVIPYTPTGVGYKTFLEPFDTLAKKYAAPTGLSGVNPDNFNLAPVPVKTFPLGTTVYRNNIATTEYIQKEKGYVPCAASFRFTPTCLFPPSILPLYKTWKAKYQQTTRELQQTYCGKIGGRDYADCTRALPDFLFLGLEVNYVTAKQNNFGYDFFPNIGPAITGNNRYVRPFGTFIEDKKDVLGLAIAHATKTGSLETGVNMVVEVKVLDNPVLPDPIIYNQTLRERGFLPYYQNGKLIVNKGRVATENDTERDSKAPNLYGNNNLFGNAALAYSAQPYSVFGTGVPQTVGFYVGGYEGFSILDDLRSPIHRYAVASSLEDGVSYIGRTPVEPPNYVLNILKQVGSTWFDTTNSKFQDKYSFITRPSGFNKGRAAFVLHGINPVGNSTKGSISLKTVLGPEFYNYGDFNWPFQWDMQVTGIPLPSACQALAAENVPMRGRVSMDLFDLVSGEGASLITNFKISGSITDSAYKFKSITDENYKAPTEFVTYMPVSGETGRLNIDNYKEETLVKSISTTGNIPATIYDRYHPAVDYYLNYTGAKQGTPVVVKMNRFFAGNYIMDTGVVSPEQAWVSYDVREGVNKNIFAYSITLLKNLSGASGLLNYIPTGFKDAPYLIGLTPETRQGFCTASALYVGSTGICESEDEKLEPNQLCLTGNVTSGQLKLAISGVIAAALRRVRGKDKAGTNSDISTDAIATDYEIYTGAFVFNKPKPGDYLEFNSYEFGSEAYSGAYNEIYHKNPPFPPVQKIWRYGTDYTTITDLRDRINADLLNTNYKLWYNSISCTEKDAQGYFETTPLLKATIKEDGNTLFLESQAFGKAGKYSLAFNSGAREILPPEDILKYLLPDTIRLQGASAYGLWEDIDVRNTIDWEHAEPYVIIQDLPGPIKSGVKNSKPSVEKPEIGVSGSGKKDLIYSLTVTGLDKCKRPFSETTEFYQASSAKSCRDKEEDDEELQRTTDSITQVEKIQVAASYIKTGWKFALKTGYNYYRVLLDNFRVSNYGGPALPYVDEFLIGNINFYGVESGHDTFSGQGCAIGANYRVYIEGLTTGKIVGTASGYADASTSGKHVFDNQLAVGIPNLETTPNIVRFQRATGYAVGNFTGILSGVVTGVQYYSTTIGGYFYDDATSSMFFSAPVSGTISGTGYLRGGPYTIIESGYLKTGSFGTQFVTQEGYADVSGYIPNFDIPFSNREGFTYMDVERTINITGGCATLNEQIVATGITEAYLPIETGYKNAAAYIQYGVPAQFDSVTINGVPIAYATGSGYGPSAYYDSPQTLVDIINSSPEAFGAQAYLVSSGSIRLVATTSGVSGNNITLASSGSPSVSASNLTGGKTYYQQMRPTSPFTGQITTTVCAEAYFESAAYGDITGELPFLDQSRHFTGIWNLFTGDVNYRANGWIQSGVKYQSEPVTFYNTPTYFNLGVSYNGSVVENNVDVARLRIIGLNFGSGVEYLLSGQY